MKFFFNYKFVVLTLSFSTALCLQGYATQLIHKGENDCCAKRGSNLTSVRQNAPMIDTFVDIKMNEELQVNQHIEITKYSQNEIWLEVKSDQVYLEEIRKSLHKSTPTHLSLSTLSLEDSALEMLGDFPSVQYYYLEANCFTDEGAKFLNNLTDIKEIDLSRNYITAKGLSYLNLDELEILYLNSLTLNNGPFLVKLSTTAKKLQELYIARTSLDKTSLGILERLNSLRTLDISGNNFQSYQIQALREKIPSVKVIF